MCSECLMSPCHPRCPNALEPTPIFRCRVCGEGIYEGDKYFDDGNSEICSECMDDMSVEEMLELFGETMKTA